jgi:hypothetical protein
MSIFLYRQVAGLVDICGELDLLNDYLGNLELVLRICIIFFNSKLHVCAIYKTSNVPASFNAFPRSS